MEAKYTVGPWEVAKLHEQGLYMNDGSMTVRTEDFAICSVLAVDDPKRGKGHNHADPERDANARLIAASPELLAACVAWKTYNDSDDVSGLEMMLKYNDALELTSAAIAKAIGNV